MSHNAVRLLLMAVEAFRQRREALEFETGAVAKVVGIG
jgi:hypothetical protein